MNSRSSGPRKVVVGTSTLGLWGPYPGLAARLEELGELIDDMAAQAASKFPGQGLDMAALPEFAVNGMSKPAHCRDMAQTLQGPVLDAMAAKARQHNCYVTVPLYMVEDRTIDHYSNVVALLDREGQLMGLYCFTHPSAQEVAFGLTPGREFPVFDCDFGRIGIQICGDVHHEEGWRALADQGAELVVHTSQPPTPVTVAVRVKGGLRVLAGRGPRHLLVQRSRNANRRDGPRAGSHDLRGCSPGGSGRPTSRPQPDRNFLAVNGRRLPIWGASHGRIRQTEPSRRIG